MRRALLFFLLLGLPAAARAEQIEYTVETLVQMSDIIVVGTLRDVYEHTADGTDYGQGRIAVREVIWGRAAPGDSLLLKWSNDSDIGCPRVEHRSDEGREGVWLLTSDGEAVRADYLGSFAEIETRGQVEKALARSPVVLRRYGSLFMCRGACTFYGVYRNVSNAPRDFPGVAYEGGRLLLAKGSALEVKILSAGGNRRAALSDHVVAGRELAPVTVAARGEHRLEIDLRGLLADEPKEGDSYVVALRLGGHQPTSELRFYVGGPDSTHSSASAKHSEKGVYVFAEPARRGRLLPLRRAGLTALIALALFPFFHRLRASLSRARLARVAHGAQTWQI